MKSFRKTILAFVAAALFIGASTANSPKVFGKTKEYRLIGTIIEINRDARTIIVRDRGANKFTPSKSQLTSSSVFITVQRPAIVKTRLILSSQCQVLSLISQS